MILKLIPLQMTNQVKNKLKDFLSLHKTEKGNPYTHTLMGGAGYPAGSFAIPLNERSQLYQLIEETVFRDQTPVCLTEKPSDKSPLRIDLDFKFENPSEGGRVDLAHQYQPDDIKQVVSTYNQLLHQYFNIDKQHLNCYVMEREQAYIDPKNQQIIKDGIHLMYPNIIVSKTTFLALRKLILPKLKCKLLHLLDLVKTDIDGVIDDIVDNNWLVYGCSKPNIPPYLLTNILDAEGDSLLDIYPIEPLDLIETLRVNLEPDTPETAIRNEYIELFKLAENGLRKKPSRLFESNQLGGGFSPDQLIIDDRVVNREDSGIVEEARKLTLLLSKKRADEYFSWIRVGWCLRNINIHLLSAWIEFSRKSDKFQEGVCEHEWAKTGENSGGYGIGSLYYWAQEDNPEGFKEFNNQRIDSLVKKASNCSDQDVAHLVHKIYRDEFVSTDGGAKKSEKIWYRFSNHRWSECDGKTLIRTKLGLDIPDYCRLTKIRVIEQRRRAVSEEDKNYLDKMEEDIGKLIIKIKNSTFKNKIVEECTYMFYDPTFFEKLDENIDLIGCENGIFNLATGEFRKGHPSDYVSMSTGLNYQEGDEEGPYNQNHSKIQGIDDFFKKIQPNPNVCQFLQLIAGYSLFGRNILELLIILEGVGGNGKSKFIELIENALGPYASNIASNYFTQKRANSGQANPDVAKIIHARIVTTQEMEENEKFNLATLKSITGCDRLVYRQMYGTCREIRPKFNIMMAVNHLPVLPADDEGTWRRVRLIKFLSRFVDNPDPNSPFEHKKDPLLASKFQKWKEATLYLLFQWHRQFRENGCKIKEPQEVLNATRDYQKSNDQYTEFIETFITQKVGGFLSLDKLFVRLKNWWEENSSTNKPDKKQFRALLEKRWQTPCTPSREFGLGWPGRELCDGLGALRTTNRDNEEISYFSLSP